jgi:hypothetical protein
MLIIGGPSNEINVEFNSLSVIKNGAQRNAYREVGWHRIGRGHPKLSRHVARRFVPVRINLSVGGEDRLLAAP